MDIVTVEKGKTMAEYINLERAMFEADRYFKNRDEVKEDLDNLFCMLVSEDVAPVRHGNWIKGKSEIYECSYCGKSAPYSTNSEYIIEYWPALNYCPNCGVKMNLF